VYSLERCAFSAVGIEPPREAALDLIARAVLIASFLILGASAFFLQQAGPEIVGTVVIVLALAPVPRSVLKARLRRATPAEPAEMTVLRRSGWRALGKLVWGLTIGWIGVALVLTVLNLKAGIAVSIILVAVLGGPLLVRAATIIVGFAPDVVWPRARISITDCGLHQAVVRPHVVVPWAEITEISLVGARRVKKLRLTVRDPAVALHRRRLIRALQRTRWVGRVLHLYAGPVLLAESAGHEERSRHATTGSSEATFVVPMAGFAADVHELASLLHNHPVKVNLRTDLPEVVPDITAESAIASTA